MIPSGTLIPGVESAMFGLPDHTAYRCEIPDARLIDYVSDYQVLDSDFPLVGIGTSYTLPAWPTIRITFAARRMTAKLGDQHYGPVAQATLWGTTTRAVEVTPFGGVTIVVAITPLGWARLFNFPASNVRDQIIPLVDVMPRHAVEALVDPLSRSDKALEIKPILDQFLLESMLPLHTDEAEIRKLLHLIGDPATRDLGEAARQYDISPSRLSRLSNRHFGYPPKRLLMRSRFMRSFMPMFDGDRRCDFSLIDDSYVDISHFLRDARRFLGMTPAQFMAKPTPYLNAVVRGRNMVHRRWHDIEQQRLATAA